MKKIKMMLLSAATIVFTLLAYIGAASACNVSWYQPEVPENLRKF